MNTTIRIIDGQVYDPKNSVDGKVQDIYIKDGKIVKESSDKGSEINAKGMIVMPGGIDMHSHIAGPKVNLGRKLQPEDHSQDVQVRGEFTRSGTGGTVPSTFTTGYRYTTLGYTTVLEAAVPPLGARHTIEELQDTPIIDKAFLTLFGNNIMLFDLLEKGDMESFFQAVGWWLHATKTFGIKVVNPGADEIWKSRNENLVKITENVEGFNISSEKIIDSLINVNEAMGLPHAVHIHCNNLGHSGNYQTTIDTMKIAGDRRLHVTHIQFNSYAGKLGELPKSGAKQISDYMNDHPNISADVGQVMFGKSTIMTADAPTTYLLRSFADSEKWVNADTECESGCGIIPFRYQEKSHVHSLQWAVGLELFLMAKDPWRMVLSTDHPNGGSFQAYPKIIHLLMDKNFRKEQIKLINQDALKSTELPNLDREFSYQEIAIITSAGPAKILGIDENKGHLGTGADADIRIYEPDQDKEKMFSSPRYVIKNGNLIIENNEFRQDLEGKLLYIRPDYEKSIEQMIKPFFEDYYSVQFENYPVSDKYVEKNSIIIPNKPKK